MHINYVSLKDTAGGTDLNACKYNLQALDDGVNCQGCIDARPTNDAEKQRYSSYHPEGTYLTTIEYYSNGGINIFVREVDGKRPIAFIKIRPELS